MYRLGGSALLGLCLVLTACSSAEPSIALPDRAEPGAQQEEARIAALLAAEASGPASCQVRLLGEVGPADYVWADCQAGESGYSAPARIDGQTVTFPEDGSQYAPSLRRIFPADIADAVLADGERYHP